jgi:hypothetical protein
MKKIVRSLSKNMAAILLVLAWAFALRALAGHFNQSEVRSRLVHKFSQAQMLAVTIDEIHFERGDYLIELHRPPLLPQRWTYNLYTAQWIPWGAIPTPESDQLD